MTKLYILAALALTLAACATANHPPPRVVFSSSNGIAIQSGGAVHYYEFAARQR